MDSTRREFIKQAGAGVLGASALAGGAVETAGAAPAVPSKAAYTTPTLIAVYLRGGADMLGTIPPYGDKEYTRLHPNIAIPGPEGKGTSASLSSGRALPLDDIFGFNPNMRKLYEMYEQGMCVPIVCSGSPHPTRSHFDAQDFMERAAPGIKTVTTGWLNRYLTATRTAKDANLRSISLQSLLPRSLRGDYPVLAKPDQKAELAMAMYNQLYGNKKPTTTPTTGTGSGNKQLIQDLGARTIEQFTELVNILDRSPPPAAKYPESGYGRQMRDIAKIIKAKRGLEITALDIGGWDHHINEAPIEGQLGKKLGDVSDSIGAFFEDIGPDLGKNVMVLVMSEFGRTARENNNKGTDHGHGGFMLAVGGKLNGRKVYGKWTGLDHLHENRDLPVHTDFRTVFGEVLKGVFNFDGIKDKMFPQYTSDAPPLNMMKNA